MQQSAPQYSANSLEPHWMPFTANREFKENPRLFVHADGMFLRNHHGNDVLDASAGLFCVAAGHGRKEIQEAVSRQLGEMDYAPPFQMGHPGAFELARRLAQITPEDLNHTFFCCSGSEAADTSMKIALAYHKARGEGQRIRFVGRERAYHGVNFGGLSVAGLVKNRDAFGPLLPGVSHIRHTHLPEHKFVRGQPETGAELADDLERMVQLHGGDTIAACIVEPIAGSTGCLVPPKGYLDRLRAICDKHGILLIFDEVICAFGRTGKAFGSQSFGVTPDMINMAKALTNGCVPMGAVAVRDGIYDTIMDAAPEGAVELFHGYTYSAAPVAVAAALASQDIYEREGLFDRAAEMSGPFLDRLFSLKGLPIVADIRGYGLLGAVDVVPDDMPGKRGFQAFKKLYENGVLTKATGDAILFSPPLIVEEAHLDRIFDATREALEAF